MRTRTTGATARRQDTQPARSLCRRTLPGPAAYSVTGRAAQSARGRAAARRFRCRKRADGANGMPGQPDMSCSSVPMVPTARLGGREPERDGCSCPRARPATPMATRGTRTPSSGGSCGTGPLRPPRPPPHSTPAARNRPSQTNAATSQTPLNAYGSAFPQKFFEVFLALAAPGCAGIRLLSVRLTSPRCFGITCRILDYST
jgi:hypothetical protein